jgi:hypothetical protein
VVEGVEGAVDVVVGDEEMDEDEDEDVEVSSFPFVRCRRGTLLRVQNVDVAIMQARTPAIAAIIRIRAGVETCIFSNAGTNKKPINRLAIVFPMRMRPKASLDSAILNPELQISQNSFCRSITQTSDHT